MKTLFQMAVAFAIGFAITAVISASITKEHWYLIIQFKSTGRVEPLLGPFVSKVDCETDPIVKQHIEAASKIDSLVKCTNKFTKNQ